MRSQPKHYDVAIDDITLGVHEWPGQGDPILLLHATGFHSRCWDQIVKRLPDAHIFAVDLRFHGTSSARGTVNRETMASDICRLLDKLALHQILGVGHSLGGYITARVAAEKTDRFRSLVLIDPVIPPLDQAAASRDVETMTAEMHPVSRRKNQWRDSEEMFARFSQKPPFDRWQETVLRDYCAYALVEVPGESYLQLACDPLHEAGVYVNEAGVEEIYRLLPKLQLPITLMRAAPAENHQVDLSGSPTFPGLIDLLPQGREIYLPELSHFIPMEDPDLVANTIIEAARNTP